MILIGFITSKPQSRITFYFIIGFRVRCFHMTQHPFRATKILIVSISRETPRQIPQTVIVQTASDVKEAGHFGHFQRCYFMRGKGGLDIDISLEMDGTKVSLQKLKITILLQRNNVFIFRQILRDFISVVMAFNFRAALFKQASSIMETDEKRISLGSL